MRRVKANEEMRAALKKRRETTGESKPLDVAQEEDVRLAQDRRRALGAAAAVLSRSARWANVNTFTASVRGVKVERGVLKVLAPNKYVRQLFMPSNGNAGLLSGPGLLAAACDYSSLNDQCIIGRSGRDPEAIRVDGGRGGSTELAMLNGIEYRGSFLQAARALDRSTTDQVVAQLIREITDFVVLEGGHPIDKFNLPADFSLGNRRADRTVKATFLRQGLGVLCQHFRNAG